MTSVASTPMMSPKSPSEDRGVLPLVGGAACALALLAGAAYLERRRAGAPTLLAYARDLTAAARNGELDPVIGRHEEVDRLVAVLSRRGKNNPVLIGQPGVGKTAIVESLAQRIAQGDIPRALRGKRVLALSVGNLVAGTKYRGEFEDRVKHIMQEVRRCAREIILFIDELHTVVGAGAALGGALDMAAMIKPELARGDLQCIGATTLDEYRTYIEADPALERRFQPVLIKESGIDETVAILRGLRAKYAAHHRVWIEDDALEAAANLSAQYIADRRLPDKAIDLMDEAAATVAMREGTIVTPTDILAIVVKWTGIPSPG